jgi:KaiC/GvpD/RAD55 family RecA-like ATPase
MYLSLGDRQLNDIFGSDKGIPCGDRKLKILLEGETGTGKTTLALQLASSFCSSVRDPEKLRLCTFFCFEESSKELEKLVYEFGWSKNVETFSGGIFSYINPSKKDLQQDNVANAIQLMEKYKPDIERLKDALNKKESGAIIFVNLPRYPTQADKTPLIVTQEYYIYVYRQLSHILLKYVQIDPKRVEMLHILDSLNVITEGIKSRTLLDKLMSLPAKQLGDLCGHAVFVMENYQKTEAPRFIADIVIELGIEGANKDHRFIQPVKARGIYYPLGKYYIKIEPSKGIVCLGNQRHIHQEAIQRISNLEYKEWRSIIPSFGIEGLDNLLEKARKKAGLSLKDLRVKLSTLVAGHSGTFKTLIATIFFAQSCCEHNAPALFISFSDVQERIQMIIKNICSGVSECLSKNKYQLWIDPKYSLPEEILYEIRNKIESLDVKPCRIVLYGLTYLSKDDSGKQLISSILRLCEAYDVMVLATDTFTLEENDSYWESLFDNVILCRYATPSPNENFRIVTITKFAGKVMTDLHKQLLQGDSEFSVKVEPGIFDHIVELFPGKLSYGDLRLNLYYETPRMKNFMMDIKRTLIDESPMLGKETDKLDVIIFRPSSMSSPVSTAEVSDLNSETGNGSNIVDNIIEGVKFHPTFLRRNITEILTYDETWVEDLISRNRLSLLNKFNESFLSESHEVISSNYIDSIRDTIQLRPDGACYGYPFYLNVGVFCYRKDLIDIIRINLELNKNNGTDSKLKKFIDNLYSDQEILWDDILTFGNDIVKHLNNNGLSPQYELLDYCLQSSESLNSFVLEMLWNLLMKDIDQNQLETIYKSLEDVYYKGLFNKEIVLDSESKMKTNTIFSRHWYTTYLNLNNSLVSSFKRNDSKESDKPLFDIDLSVNASQGINVQNLVNVLRNYCESHKITFFSQNLTVKNQGNELLILDREKKLAFIAKIEDDSLKVYKWFSPPNLVLRTMPVIASGMPSVSMSGDWFLGILEGAVNLRYGTYVLEYIIDRARQDGAFSNILGLDPRRLVSSVNPNINQEDPSELRAMKLRSIAKTRCSIKNYMKKRSELTKIFRQFFDSYYFNDIDFDMNRISGLINNAREVIKR